MFKPIEIVPDVFYVGVNDRQKSLFENIIPLPQGVSYNSYLIMDEQTALIDTVDLSLTPLFIEKLQAQLQGRELDYLIINHIEPDHSGAIAILRKYYPDVRIVGNRKTLEMLRGFYGINSALLEIKEEEVLVLGKHELCFYMAPMVHWPETMITYDRSSRILFSGDAFGCFATLDGAVLDSEMDIDKYWPEMIRYYANIIGKYAAPVQKALRKIKSLPFDYICSTHGPVWTCYKDEVFALYDRLSRYEGDPEGAVIVYGSMYGGTELMAEALAQGLSAKGIRKIIIHNVSKSDHSEILRDVFTYKALILGSPTYNNELHPELDALLRKIESRGLKNRIFACFGTYAWASAAVKRMTAFGEKMNWQLASAPVEQKYSLEKDNYEACLQLGEEVARMLQEG